MKADYFDNEGHVIHYSAIAGSGGRWTFLSDPAPGPRFLLTYAKLAKDQLEIKFEIVLEARIVLAPPGADDQLCGVATLTPLDMATSKLLANSDRWRDDAVLSRDLIDLAMMAPTRKLLRQAIEKAKTAYGDSIEADLAKAIDTLRERPHRLDDCMRAMQMTTVPKALLWKRIRALAP